MSVSEEFLFVEKYRPNTVAETILPERLKKVFTEFVSNGTIPTLMLAGPPGCGKTTIAIAMLREIGADYMMINGSMNGNIDTLRNEIQTFASSVSLMGGRKYVILDEADGLNPSSTQPALKAFIEEFSANCGFILTCNHKNKIIAPLHSRCSIVEFVLKNEEKARMAALFFKRIIKILDIEGISFQPQVVAEVINKFFPDWRRIINELQTYSSSGEIDTGILSKMTETSFKELVTFMKAKKYTDIRSWVQMNLDNDSAGLFRKFYDTATEYITPQTIPILVITLAKYQYWAAFAADHEINLLAFLTEIMIECEFK